MKQLYFFIVGAPKAGTTFLANSLPNHPQIHMSAVKEPHFFAPTVNDVLEPTTVTDYTLWKRLKTETKIHKGCIKQWENYRRLMAPQNDEAAAGEATVAYFHAPGTTSKIAEAFPDARVIIMIREPISRALSNFHMNLAAGRIDVSAEDIFSHELDCLSRSDITNTGYLGRSLYAKNIREYQQIFGRNNVLVLRFDDLLNNVGVLLSSVLNHLDVDATITDICSADQNRSQRVRFKRLNRILTMYGVRGYLSRLLRPEIKKYFKIILYTDKKRGETTLSPTLRANLKYFFREDIEETSALTGLNLDHWKMN